MRRLFVKDDFSDLEAELRKGRPEPRPELIRELVARVGEARSPAPTRRLRVALALAFAALVLVALAASGGVGYAKSSLVAAAKSSGHVVSSVARRGHETRQSGGYFGDHDPPWGHQYHRFVLICYPFRIHGVTVHHTIVVPQWLLSYFVPPGTLGPCRIPG
jgi:hypothetical protein